MNIIDKIISNFINNKSLYIGEQVTISEHMIQSAMIAENAKSSNDLICSCLLHDYGHFILEDPNELVRKKVDGKHEYIGYEHRSHNGVDHFGILLKQQWAWLQTVNQQAA